MVADTLTQSSAIRIRCDAGRRKRRRATGTPEARVSATRFPTFPVLYAHLPGGSPVCTPVVAPAVSGEQIGRGSDLASSVKLDRPSSAAFERRPPVRKHRGINGKFTCGGLGISGARGGDNFPSFGEIFVDASLRRSRLQHFDDGALHRWMGENVMESGCSDRWSRAGRESAALWFCNSACC